MNYDKYIKSFYYLESRFSSVAEHLPRKQRVEGSIPSSGCLIFFPLISFIIDGSRSIDENAVRSNERIRIKEYKNRQFYYKTRQFARIT